MLSSARAPTSIRLETPSIGTDVLELRRDRGAAPRKLVL